MIAYRKNYWRNPLFKPALTLGLCLFLLCGLAKAAALQTVSPEESLNALKTGNRGYVENRVEPMENLAELRARLANEGQNPIAAIIGCADSRVPVELIFQQRPGELFVIRNAGNTADIQSTGSVQYAVDHLNVPLVVVVGHTRCGAVEGVIAGSQASGNLAKMLRPIQDAAKVSVCTVDKGRNAELTVTKANIRNAIRTLLIEIDGLSEKVCSGQVMLAGAVYDIETGLVEWL